MKIRIEYTVKQLDALYRILQDTLEENEPTDYQGQLVYLHLMDLSKKVYNRIYSMSIAAQAKTRFTYSTEHALAVSLWWLSECQRYQMRKDMELSINLVQSLTNEVHKANI